MTALSGQAPFRFFHRPDLSALPQAVQAHEVDLHGGFAVDDRPNFGHIYYGMPNGGIMRIDPDLQRQEVIALPADLQAVNFHSTRIATFDGNRRLILPANNDELVAVLTLEGAIDFILPRPEFEAYTARPDLPFQPTDVAIDGDQLFVADGYGANYIVSADVPTQQWTDFFGGHTIDPADNSKFGTAHGITFDPFDHHLTITDRLLSRIQIHAHDGTFLKSHKLLPDGIWPCGVQFMEWNGRTIAIVGCLLVDADDWSIPAPIYILDALTYEVLSVVRPKADLNIELAQHLHNVIGHIHNGELYLVCQAWNPGHYFVLQLQN